MQIVFILFVFMSAQQKLNSVRGVNVKGLCMLLYSIYTTFTILIRFGPVSKCIAISKKRTLNISAENRYDDKTKCRGLCFQQLWFLYNSLFDGEETFWKANMFGDGEGFGKLAIFFYIQKAIWKSNQAREVKSSKQVVIEKSV